MQNAECRCSFAGSILHFAFSILHFAVMTDLPYRVPKPWGYELIWARTDRYVGKILHVEAFHIQPKLIHQFEAVETSDLLEASTPELDDVIRIKDRYGRVP